MSRTYIAEALRRRVGETARRRCGYCQSQEQIVGYPLHVEHIVPEAAGGSSLEDNLWLACSVCNCAKGVQVHGLDSVTGEEATLFNPRAHVWREHFTWSDDQGEIVGLTPIGRVTVVALQLNTPFRVQTRRLWVAVGWHPPRDP